ncbi:MAG TPA: hypothetical protein VG755_19720 [Nannocystaceae bacterium]|nr:hypothetical protein [Nannocystaceae bacterium]
METMPEVIASIIATYGAEGSCWMLPGVTEADCWTECDAQMSNLRDANPEIESCWECTSDAECTEVPWCDLVAHECVDDLIFCDAIVDTGQCFERPAHLGLPCGDTYPTEPGHCPVNAALLGTCIGAFPDGLIYYYEPLWALPGAHDACAEDDGVLRPGPP